MKKFKASDDMRKIFGIFRLWTNFDKASYGNGNIKIKVGRIKIKG